MERSNKVAINTFIIYGRMLLTVGISLYSTRLVLNALGNSDYGIYNLIAGVIAMLSFLSNTMATSTQRFLSYYQGKDDFFSQRKIFTTSIFLHLIVAFAILLFLLLTGAFLFDGFLNIPFERIQAAKGLFYFMIASVFFTIITVPFNATLIAHENMLFVAVVNIIEVLLRVIAAISLYYITIDRLVGYGAFILAITIVSFIMYVAFCLKNYRECRISKRLLDRKMLNQLSSLASWNLFGSLASMGRLQGTAILFNLFIGTIINAAYGIANQVSSQMSFFSSTLIRALDPQIMKSEGAENRQRMIRLSLMACKFGFFLMAIIAIPCIVEMERILEFWLGTVPNNTVAFCRLILLSALINQLSIGLQSAIQAIGNVKMYQLIVSAILICNLPVAYFLLRFKYNPNLVLGSYCIIELIASGWKFLYLNKTTSLTFKAYAKTVLAKIVLPSLTAVCIALYCKTYVQMDNLRFIITVLCSSVSSLVVIYLAGLEVEEKKKVNNLILNVLKFVKR